MSSAAYAARWPAAPEHLLQKSAPSLPVSISSHGAEAALVGHLLHVPLTGQLLQLRLLVVQQLSHLHTGHVRYESSHNYSSLGDEAGICSVVLKLRS